MLENTVDKENEVTHVEDQNCDTDACAARIVMPGSSGNGSGKPTATAITITGDITPTNSAAVSNLLMTLRSPSRSQLSRKRTVDRNPPLGKK